MAPLYPYKLWKKLDKKGAPLLPSPKAFMFWRLIEISWIESIDYLLMSDTYYFIIATT